MIEFCGNQIKTINNNNSLIVKSCARFQIEECPFKCPPCDSETARTIFCKCGDQKVQCHPRPRRNSQTGDGGVGQDQVSKLLNHCHSKIVTCFQKHLYFS